MGLDGIERAEKMGDFVAISPPFIGPLLKLKASAAKTSVKVSSDIKKLPPGLKKFDCSYGNGLEAINPASFQLLRESLENEGHFHPCYDSLLDENNQEDRVTHYHRDDAISNLRCLHIFYHLSPETFALAVNLLDRFLAKVKARPKYLSCIAATCYFIAVKTCEESRDIPRLSDLLSLSQCTCTSSDSLRMESIILSKLNFDLHAVTATKFLKLYFSIVKQANPWISPYVILEDLLPKLEICLCRCLVIANQPRVLAMAVLNQMLQGSGLLQDKTLLSTVINLQLYCQIPQDKLKSTQEIVGDLLYLYSNMPTQMPKIKLQWKMSSRTILQITRSSYHGYSELPIIQEVSEREQQEDGNKDCDTDINNNFIFISPLAIKDEQSCDVCPMRERCNEIQPNTALKFDTCSPA